MPPPEHDEGRPLAGAATNVNITDLHSIEDAEPTFQPMPELAPEEYEALKADITANGIIVPVVVDQHGRVLDGHNRKAIAVELGIECPVAVREVTDDDDAIDLAVTLNCARRHLSREQVREVIANEIERRPDDSDRAIARRVGCSPSTVAMVRALAAGRAQVSNLDSGPAAGRPVAAEPVKQRRRPLPDAYRDNAYRLEKVVTSLSNLHEDDRFTRNRDSIQHFGAYYVARAANELLKMLDELGIDRHQYDGDSE